MERGKWKKSIVDDTFLLLNEEGAQIATLSRYNRHDLWQVTFSFYKDYFHAENSDIAKWRATNQIINSCDIEISKFAKIRDHLPDICELAKEAGLT